MRRNSSVNLIVTIIAILALVLVLIPIFSSIGGLSDAANKVTCEHKNQENVTTKYSHGDHTYNTNCKDCGEVLKKDQTGKHTWNELGVCTLCKFACDHAADVNTYTLLNLTRHVHRLRCNICGYDSAEAEEHAFEEGACGLCDYNCRHLMSDTISYQFYRDGNGEPWCLVGCGTKFDYLKVDNAIMYAWEGGDGITWFYFDWEYDFTVDGEVVGNESGLVVCHEDGTPVHRDEIVKSGENYVRMAKEHGEIIKFDKVDKDECEHNFVTVNRVDPCVKCTSCGYKVHG